MTSPPAPHAPEDRIPEERVPAILARAAELDRDRRETISVDALRAAALDAGISPTAVDAALEEYAARMDTPPTREVAQEREPRFGRARRFFRKAATVLRTPLKLAGMLFVLGLTGAAGEGMVIAGWGVWLLLTGRLIWRHRPARKVAPFALALLFMTIGLATGFAATEVVDEEAIGMLFAVGVPLLAIGSLIIKVRLPRRFRSSAGSSAGELGAPAR